MREYFQKITSKVFEEVKDGETVFFALDGEETGFCRFNKGKIRQTGEIFQVDVSLNLIFNSREARKGVRLSLNEEEDLALLNSVLLEMREMTAVLPEDKFINFSEEPINSINDRTCGLPAFSKMIEDVAEKVGEKDFVGILVSGKQYSGLASSIGAFCWHVSESFNLDFSVYVYGDKAVKGSYCGVEWDSEELSDKLTGAFKESEFLSNEAVDIDPGEYRVYLAPSAVEEIFGMLSWGGFGAQPQMTKQSPLHRLAEGLETLDPRVSVTENTEEGTAPCYNGYGFLRPGKVKLIENGVYKNHLVSPRSAKEYGLESNGSGLWESPQDYDVAAGDLKQEDVLKKLDNGIYINNLWYLNYSDRNNARITGMTRFACFLVENGEIKAPVNVLRFDDSIYRIFGENLEEITEDRDFILDSGTYYSRSFSSKKIPGLLLKKMNFTL